MASPRSTGTRRRSAAEARAAILDAAEVALSESGAEGVRLQQVAAQAGITHSGLLYHFGTRQGLFQSLFRRSSDRMRRGIATHLAGVLEETDRSKRMEVLFTLYEDAVSSDRQQLLAWLIACGEDPFASDEVAGLRALAEQLHRMRQSETEDAEVDLEDTLFVFQLMSLVIFGDLLLGDSTRARLGLAEPAASDAFRRRLVDLLLSWLDESGDGIEWREQER
jgi:AcrR family transcriptional regulator